MNAIKFNIQALNTIAAGCLIVAAARLPSNRIRKWAVEGTVPSRRAGQSAVQPHGEKNVHLGDQVRERLL